MFRGSLLYPESAPLLTRTITGILLKIASTIAFTAMSSLVRVAGQEVPVGQVVFCRAFFALIPLFLVLGLRGQMGEAVRLGSFTGHVKRGIIGASGMCFGFIALTLLPLADAVTIGYAAPLMVVPLAVWILGEKVRVYRWTAVAVGFIGVVVILWPHLADAARPGGWDAQAAGALAALGGAVCAAFATIQVRKLVSTETTASIVFMFMALCSVVALCTLPLGYVLPIGRWVIPNPTQMMILVVIGIFGGLGQMLLTESYKRADTSLIAPFEYFSMIWAVLIGYIIFSDVPGPFVVVGGAIVVASGLMVIWREHILGLERARARQAVTPQG